MSALHLAISIIVVFPILLLLFTIGFPVVVTIRRRIREARGLPEEHPIRPGLPYQAPRPAQSEPTCRAGDCG